MKSLVLFESQIMSVLNTETTAVADTNSSGSINQQQHNNNATDADGLMNIPREELFRLLSLLKSELQSKEIALAAIKCEQLKRLINPIEINRSSLANTYIELQDKLKTFDQNNNASNNGSSDEKTNENTKHQLDNQTIDLAQASDKNILNNTNTINTDNCDNDAVMSSNEAKDREKFTILNTLLELLDQHPLLALPRDSIYCLDYNCNELSTKNYLNLKIQHLDNLINQHRQFRYYVNEHLKRCEMRNLELNRELELERSFKRENPEQPCELKTSGRSVLISHIHQLKENLEKEKRDKQTIVMTLFNDLLDERESNQRLKSRLKANESMNHLVMNDAITSEKEKCAKLEHEVEKLNSQLVTQSMVFKSQIEDLKSRVIELEIENNALKSSMTKSATNYTKAQTTKDDSTKDASGQHRVSSPSHTVTARTSLSTSTMKHSSHVVKQTSLPSPTGARPAPRGSIGAAAKIPAVGRGTSNTATNQTTSSSPKTLTSNSGGTNQSSSSPPSSSSAKHTSPLIATSRTAAVTPSTASKSSTNSDNPRTPTTTHQTKLSQVTQSSGQLVRNMKSPTTESSTSSPPTKSGNQPVVKPQVPAKPAQLLDRERNSTA